MYRQLCLLLLLLAVALPAAAADLSGTVRWVYDGDTLQVTGIGRVRLLGIDTPEMEDSARDRYYLEHFRVSRRQLRRIALLAKKFTIEQVKGQQVRLETDRTKRDRYDRLLAYVYLPNGHLLNRQLLEQGLAAVFRRYDFKRKPAFLTVENQARAAHLGLWQEHP